MGFSAYVPAAIDFAGSLIGGSMANSANSKAVQATNRSNQKIAKRANEFSERMSNTAHQREVTDLKLAGLNPILSANAGASTPQPTVIANEAPKYNDTLGPATQRGVATALQTKRLMAELDNIKKDTEKKDWDIYLNKQLGAKASADAISADRDSYLTEARTAVERI